MATFHAVSVCVFFEAATKELAFDVSQQFSTNAHPPKQPLEAAAGYTAIVSAPSIPARKAKQDPELQPRRVASAGTWAFRRPNLIERCQRGTFLQVTRFLAPITAVRGGLERRSSLFSRDVLVRGEGKDGKENKVVFRNRRNVCHTCFATHGDRFGGLLRPHLPHALCRSDEAFVGLP
ncbi:hypothetical protein MRX96_012448 [Rhipicephalus microplus]